MTLADSRLPRPAGLLRSAVVAAVLGIAVVTVIVLLAGLTALPTTPAWRQAMTSAPLEALANTVKVWLPSDLSKHINYG